MARVTVQVSREMAPAAHQVVHEAFRRLGVTLDVVVASSPEPLPDGAWRLTLARSQVVTSFLAARDAQTPEGIIGLVLGTLVLPRVSDDTDPNRA